MDVLDIPAAKAFYCDVLGAAVGRECDEWMALADSIEDRGCTFFQSPVALSAGTGKAYRNVDALLGTPITGRGLTMTLAAQRWG